MQEDWDLLMNFFPENWKELAFENDALKGLRKNKSAENLLRTLLIHIGCGYSFRETVVRAKKANLADLSDVAFMKRLRKSKQWLCMLCTSLFKEQGVTLSEESNFNVRLFDATNIKEPGKTGSLWRIHYSVTMPSLCCDFFKLTETKGKGTGESFFQYPVKNNDYIIADRGYSTASGIHYIVSKKAFVIVRVNTQALLINNLNRKSFSLLKHVQSIRKTGLIKSWNVLIPGHDNSYVKGRICAIRKTEEAIKIAHAKLKSNASKHGTITKPETYEYAKYVIVFTNYPKEDFSPFEILEWYRLRWQVEVTFKRFKSLAQLGHLPKHDDESSKAWLYGKLFVALLIEKLIKYATSISPWGYLLEEQSTSKCMA